MEVLLFYFEYEPAEQLFILLNKPRLPFPSFSSFFVVVFFLSLHMPTLLLVSCIHETFCAECCIAG